MKKIKTLLAMALVIALLALNACSSEEANEPAEIDWSRHSIIIDGEIGVEANLHTAFGSDFPTHVPLAPVAAALGAVIDINDTNPPTVTMEGLNGTIRFTVGSYLFDVAGSTVELWQPSLFVGNDIYVPIPFFRAVYGMGQAMWMSGHVHIDTEADDMM